jgi:hypothetical protein
LDTLTDDAPRTLLDQNPSERNSHFSSSLKMNCPCESHVQKKH